MSSAAKDMVGIDEIKLLLAGDGQPPLSERRIGQLVDEGMPKVGHGKYDPLVCMHWYLGKLRPAVQRKATEGQDGITRNLQDERARLIAAQADAAEMDRDERRGQLIPLDVYEQQTSAWAHTTKQLILGLPARLVPKLDGLPRDQMRGILKSACDACLVDISKALKPTRIGDRK